MNIIQAMRTAMRRSFDFRGRSSRSEFWWFELFLLPFTVLAWTDVEILVLIGGMVVLPAFIASWSVTVRRLHDTGRSAWYLLLLPLPLIGLVAMLCFLCQDSTPGVNRYGPSPKEPVALGPPVTGTAPFRSKVVMSEDVDPSPVPHGGARR